MIRTIIKIDEELCNGCGLCADACHEGAIAVVEGKAKLLRDDYCDGLGNCLPVCPTEAITFEVREAAAFDEEAVERNMAAQAAQAAPTMAEPLACGCPGSAARAFERPAEAPVAPGQQSQPSQLRQWPVQIKLVPVQAPYFEQADILIAADCAAYAYADFHNDFIKNRITLIGCPKLDEGDYTEKLTAVLSQNNVKSLTVTRMEVPCCGGIEYAARTAVENSGKNIPVNVVTLSTDGQILE